MAGEIGTGKEPLVRGYFVPVVDPVGEQPLTVAELLQALRARWLMITLVTLAVTALGVAAAFGLTKRYDARVVLLPVAEGQGSAGLGGLLSQFGGLASMASLNLGGDNLKTQAYATLVSRKFADDFIRDEGLLPVLFASRWDEATQAWRPSLWRENPTPGDAFTRFDRKVRLVDQDRRTGIVTLTIRWTDPEQAARWADLLVERLNAQLRAQAMQEARRNIEHLKAEFDRTQVVTIRESIARVMENEIRREMMAAARTDYAFRVIDPAVIPGAHEFVSPNRKLLIAAALAAGLFLGLFMAVVTYFHQREGSRRS